MVELGLVGLPNVGKSTLFTALTEKEVAAENYPFCTVDSNVGLIEVKDERLEELCCHYQPDKCTPSTIKFIDIAGLVEGASRGEGLGNQFLARIREVDAIVQIVRLFEDDNISHVMGEIDPIRDIKVIREELIAADLKTVARRKDKAVKMQKTGERKYREEEEALRRMEADLEKGIPVRKQQLTDFQQKLLPELFLLTAKPTLYLGNVKEQGTQADRYREEFIDYIAEEQEESVLIDALFAREMVELPPEEREIFLAEQEGDSGLENFIKASYELLDLITFFTVAGGEEVRATGIPRNTPAPEAAGKIHSDMEEGFIKAEVINFKAWQEFGSLEEAKNGGQVKLAGRDYLIQDGDICYFHFKK